MVRLKPWVGAVAFMAACVTILALARWRFGGVAPMPAAFAANTSLQDALAQSRLTGRPVLALATADWCGPCQAFKRGALADERVGAWIGGNVIPVSVDLTDGDDAGAREAARLLQVNAVPALTLLEGGEIVARTEGAMTADELVMWLERVTQLDRVTQPERATPAGASPTPGG